LARRPIDIPVKLPVHRADQLGGIASHTNLGRKNLRQRLRLLCPTDQEEYTCGAIEDRASQRYAVRGEFFDPVGDDQASRLGQRCRVQKERLLFDVRTLLEGEAEEIAAIADSLLVPKEVDDFVESEKRGDSRRAKIVLPSGAGSSAPGEPGPDRGSDGEGNE